MLEGVLGNDWHAKNIAPYLTDLLILNSYFDATPLDRTSHTEVIKSFSLADEKDCRYSLVELRGGARPFRERRCSIVIGGEGHWFLTLEGGRILGLGTVPADPTIVIQGNFHVRSGQVRIRGLKSFWVPGIGFQGGNSPSL